MTRLHDVRAMERQRVDVVMDPSGAVKAVPAGKGGEIVRSYNEREPSKRRLRRALVWLLVALVLAYSLLIVRNPLLGGIAAAVIRGRPPAPEVDHKRRVPARQRRDRAGRPGAVGGDPGIRTRVAIAGRTESRTRARARVRGRRRVGNS